MSSLSDETKKFHRDWYRDRYSQKIEKSLDTEKSRDEMSHSVSQMSDELWKIMVENGRLLVASPMIICKSMRSRKGGFSSSSRCLMLCWSNKGFFKLNAQLITVLQELEKLSSTISVISFWFFYFVWLLLRLNSFTSGPILFLVIEIAGILL